MSKELDATFQTPDQIRKYRLPLGGVIVVEFDDPWCSPLSDEEPHQVDFQEDELRDALDHVDRVLAEGKLPACSISDILLRVELGETDPFVTR